MPIHYRIDPDQRVVHLTASGESGFAEWEAAVLAVFSDPSYRPGLNVLSDSRYRTGESEPGAPAAAADLLTRHSDRVRGCRWAMVSSDQATYRAQCVFAILVKRAGVTAQAFRDYDTARRWLPGAG